MDFSFGKKSKNKHKNITPNDQISACFPSSASFLTFYTRTDPPPTIDRFTLGLSLNAISSGLSVSATNTCNSGAVNAIAEVNSSRFLLISVENK